MKAFLLALLASVALLTGCATTPVAEVRLVAQSFEDLNSASQPLFDDLALAEREQGKRAAIDRAKDRTGAARTAAPTAPPTDTAMAELALPDMSRCPGIILQGGETANTPTVQTGFCAADSYYYSILTDPPATAAFRRALAAVGDYTQLLVVLAEGGNIAEAQAQLQSLTSNVGIALAAVGLGPGGPALGGALQALQPVLERAAKYSNAEELKRLVLAESPKVEAVLDALRGAAPELFNTLAEAPFARFNSGAALESPALATAEAQRIEGYRIAVSNYVVLLDQYRALLGDLVASYDTANQAATLAGLAGRSAELSAAADAWRRTFSALRIGIL